MADYNAIPDPLPTLTSLREAALTTKETVEILTNQRGNIRAAAVTWQNLLDLGLVTESQLQQGTWR